MLIAVASNGGPIAITSDKSKALLYKATDPTLQHTLFFDSVGKEFHR